MVVEKCGAVHAFAEALGVGEQRPLRVISRAASASPATGSTKKHQAEQAELIAQAFDR